MKKNVLKFLILLFICLFLLTGCSNNSSNETNNESDASKLSTIIDNNNSNINNSKPKIEEKEISSFSTEIKDNSPGRLTNINITCNILNNTIINPRRYFFF